MVTAKANQRAARPAHPRKTTDKPPCWNIQPPRIPPSAEPRNWLDRKYSASPGEAFFTGGGLHVFHNFRNEDNGRMPSLRDAIRESINLPFIRLMRDLVRYSTYSGPNSSAELLGDDRDP